MGIKNLSCRRMRAAFRLRDVMRQIQIQARKPTVSTLRIKPIELLIPKLEIHFTVRQRTYLTLFNTQYRHTLLPLNPPVSRDDSIMPLEVFREALANN